MSAPAEVCFSSELSACWTSKPRPIKSVATSCLQRSDDDHRNSECKHSFPKSTNKYKKTPSYGYVLKRIHQKAEYLQFSSLKIWAYMVYSLDYQTWNAPGFPTVSGTHLDRPSRNASMTVSRSSRHFRKPWRWLWNLDIFQKIKGKVMKTPKMTFSCWNMLELMNQNHYAVNIRKPLSCHYQRFPLGPPFGYISLYLAMRESSFWGMSPWMAAMGKLDSLIFFANQSTFFRLLPAMKHQLFIAPAVLTFHPGWLRSGFPVDFDHLQYRR